MSKKWGLLLGILLLGAIFWYMFLKPHDYVVRFEIKALPGTINQTIKSWSNGLDNAQFLSQDDFFNLKYSLKFNDSIHSYNWNIVSINDSISKVKAYVTDAEHSLANRLAIPFSETDFEKRTKQTVEGFANLLIKSLEGFKIRVTGRDSIPSKYCACVSLNEIQLKKANGMKDYYSLLSGVMAEKNIALDGRPMIAVEGWNMQNDSLSFNFCFPVVKSDSLPKKSGIFYKQIEKKPAIRAVYNGNYITSDRAWYALLEYAEQNDITIDKKPLEIFHNNPNMGGNELEWKTEVFMPIR